MVLSPVSSLGRMRNPVSFVTPVEDSITSRMRASGGGADASAVRNAASALSSPSNSMKTPAMSLRTQPASESAWARRQTNGRNPTPWTAPLTSNLTRRIPPTVCLRGNSE